MTGSLRTGLIEWGFAVLGAFVVPWAVMRSLVPTLEDSGVAVTNYRGRRVALGLGLVWVAWSVGLLGAAALLEALAVRLWWGWEFVPDASALIFYAPFVLVLGSFAVGIADDVFGSAADKGFRGHLAAARSGRLSTGALKLLAIGVLAAATVAPFASGADGAAPWAVALTRWVLATLAIALTANLVNLFDLRPGRALKVYSALIALVAVAMLARHSGAALVAIVLTVALGPVAAVWRFDLGERAMLGDAGANAAGALAGWLVVLAIRNVLALGAYVAVVLVLNLVSEKISFSAVIEKNAVLRWLDGLGRSPVPEADADKEEKSSREVVRTEK